MIGLKQWQWLLTVIGQKDVNITVAHAVLKQPNIQIYVSQTAVTWKRDTSGSTLTSLYAVFLILSS